MCEFSLVLASVVILIRTRSRRKRQLVATQGAAQGGHARTPIDYSDIAISIKMSQKDSS